VIIAHRLSSVAIADRALEQRERDRRHLLGRDPWRGVPLGHRVADHRPEAAGLLAQLLRDHVHRLGITQRVEPELALQRLGLGLPLRAPDKETRQRR
jgi:hypothetical protein